MNYNFHTHTYFCGHANGTIEEYIKNAIVGKITHMGFSEHFPYVCSNGVESEYRLQIKDIKSYFSQLYELREKYKKEIDIKIGFEMEYYPLRFEEMKKSAIEYGAEYLILGQHFLDEEQPNWEHVIEERDSIEGLQRYTDNVISAIKSGVFSYVAHPDMMNFVGDKSIFHEKIREICIASREYNTPLEINFLGIRTGRNYPNEEFWRIAGEEKSPVVFGLDAHEAQDAVDTKSLVKAREIVEKYNLNYVGMPKIMPLQKG